MQGSAHSMIGFPSGKRKKGYDVLLSQGSHTQLDQKKRECNYDSIYDTVKAVQHANISNKAIATSNTSSSLASKSCSTDNNKTY